ncbi:hypothetical protein Nepgr_025250 [Nepenthes gracilis]|uniref:Uncharacterized protein n=1 Tax=Nepenthes gracilis TaxID=150966 RepID=A0AAD3T635_NEPGR|nr:hypothetical protein Nepgr_025250 [Nepenthes gracilis]
MGFPTGFSRVSWQPLITADTTTSSYWLNWRVSLCAVWVFISIVLASFLISKFEGHQNSRTHESSENGREAPGILYVDEVWKPCLKGMHPVWLLAFRVLSFFVLLVLLIINAIVDGAGIFYYYTQWTFTLVTIYFGLGSMLSVYGCYEYHNKVGGERADNESVDAVQGNLATKNLSSLDQPNTCRVAGFWGYVFQIIFQMNAGAVMLTDFVFWLIIVPFLRTKDYHLNFFIINMHTINAVFLLGDAALNSLSFPWFRIAYFIIWTCLYVIFQWIVHACIPHWWPYPFLDLSSSLAPLWYSTMAIMHIPCYGVFVLVIKLKHFVLSRYFPQLYQCMMK